jgi:hypothetical protein
MFPRLIGSVGPAVLAAPFAALIVAPTLALAQAPGEDPYAAPPPPPTYVAPVPPRYAPDTYGPLPPVPSSAPMYYYAPPPPRYRFPRYRPEWAAQIRAEAVDLGRDASGDSGMGGVGLSLRPRPTPHFALDLGLDFVGGKDFYGERRGEVAFTVNPMFFVNPGHVVQLYFLAGMGFSAAEVEHADQTRSRYRYVGVDAGIGLEFRVAPQIALDADLVGFARRRIDRAADDSPEFVDPATGRTSNSSGGGLARLGLAYYW